MVGELHGEFRELGPHGSDVKDMGRPLGKVVLEERIWGRLLVLLSGWDGAFQPQDAERRRDKALKELKEGVNTAETEGRIGRVDFDA